MKADNLTIKQDRYEKPVFLLVVQNWQFSLVTAKYYCSYHRDASWPHKSLVNWNPSFSANNTQQFEDSLETSCSSKPVVVDTFQPASGTRLHSNLFHQRGWCRLRCRCKWGDRVTHSPPIRLHLWSYYATQKDVPVLKYIKLTLHNLFRDSVCVIICYFFILQLV